MVRNGEIADEAEVGVVEEVDVEAEINGMEAERERLAEQIRIRKESGNVDDEWVREVEAERERLAELIRLVQSGEYKFVIVDGKVLMVVVEDPEGETETDGGDPPVEEDEGDHPDDGDDHPVDGDDHPDDGDDHPDDGDDGDHHD